MQLSPTNGPCKDPIRIWVEFWPGFTGEIDPVALASAAVPVKGVSFHSPLRFLEIYANSQPAAMQSVLFGNNPREKMSWADVKRLFLPRIPGVQVALGDHIPQPPFAWREADSSYLAVSFTYNTNALFRIFNLLAAKGLVSNVEVEALLDDACLLLTWLYRAKRHFLVRNINNNFNMYLISKVVEHIVGKGRYDSELQELDSTIASFRAAMAMASGHIHLSATEKMGIALGKGVSFMENKMTTSALQKSGRDAVNAASFQFYGKRLAIDHREKLISMISDAGLQKNSFELAVILDDAAETVDDLLWLQDLMEQFPFFRAHLLVNTVQVSINFSSHMFSELRRANCFRSLMSRYGSRFLVTRVYCPFISFQTNHFPPGTRRIIDAADAVYIKGANFFETCQIPEKDTFHAFVVYGPMSRLYSGLDDFQGVFAHLPPAVSGYLHGYGKKPTVPLTEILGIRQGNDRRLERGN